MAKDRPMVPWGELAQKYPPDYITPWMPEVIQEEEAGERDSYPGMGSGGEWERRAFEAAERGEHYYDEMTNTFSRYPPPGSAARCELDAFSDQETGRMRHVQ
jgi:hypothetical protein